MKRLVLGVLIAAFAVGSALAQETCDGKAVGKDGKPLAGAAKTAFLKKCKADACAPKAVGKDGKPLAGAARNSFMKKCEEGA
jgi:predicted outer membrane lipoprotein